MLKRITENNKIINDFKHDENQYLNLIKDILEEGEFQESRNGLTKIVSSSVMHFSLENGKIPILTTKRVFWKSCLRELFWFIKGDTNNKHLKEKNVKIWNGNGSREFLDSRNLQHLKEDDLGPIYGHQWRFFNAEYSSCEENYEGKGVDQLANVINSLKNKKEITSRRLVVSAWNPCQLDEMALPPCHIVFQFTVIGNKLSCSLYQRSGDVGLGVPFNIASYSFLTHIIAKHCNLEPYEFCYHLTNCHIYDDHLDSLAEQIKRKPKEFPTIDILQQCNDINDYTEDMVKINNYEHYDTICMKMRK